MRARHNLSPAFHRLGSRDTLLTNLRPDDCMLRSINAAEALIRAQLATFLSDELGGLVPEGMKVPNAKFLRQGSNAYGTLIDPLRATVHYAQADSDLGLYFPLEFVKDGTPDPRLGARSLRELTLAGLKRIATKQSGWKVRAKECCDRVQIRSDAYIDVTSYAIPADEHRRMADERISLNFSEALAKPDLAVDEPHAISWDEIPETSLLATLGGWIPSDAKAVNETVKNMALYYGSAFKQTVRFEKALRDLHDDKAGPNSICLTLLTGQRLDLNICRMGRLDFAIVSVLGQVANGLFEFLPSPGNPDIDILGGVDHAVRHRLAEMLRDRQARISEALNASSIEVAHDMLKGVFGSRFPDPPASEQHAPSTPATSSEIGAAVLAVPTKTKVVAPRGNARSA